MEIVEKRVYKVPKIRCSGCVSTVERAASGVSGVIRANADENSKEVHLEFDPTQVSEDRIKEALARVGYPVAS